MSERAVVERFLFSPSKGGTALVMVTEPEERPQETEGEPGAEPAPKQEADWIAELERERVARKAAEELATLRDREKRGIDRRLGKVLEADRSGDAARLAQAALDEAALARAEAKDFRENKEPGALDSATKQAQDRITERQTREREAAQKSAWDVNVARAQAEVQRELEARGYKETDPELADAVGTWKAGDVWGAVDLVRGLPKKTTTEANSMAATNPKALTDKELDAIKEAARKEGYERAKREAITGGAAETTPSTAGGGRDTDVQRRLDKMKSDDVAKLIADGNIEEIRRLEKAIKQGR